MLRIDHLRISLCSVVRQGHILRHRPQRL